MGDDTPLVLGIFGLFGIIALLAYLASRPVAPPPSEVEVEETEAGWIIKERPAGKGYWKLVKPGGSEVQIRWV